MQKRDQKTATFSRQPGRFPRVDLEKPFAHRVRKRASESNLHELLLAQHREAIRVAVGTLQLLLGNARQRVSKKQFKKNSVRDAQAAVARLLTSLQKAAPQALSARVVMRDGELKAETPPEEPRDEREGLNADKQAYLYPSNAVLYPHSTVVRLYK